MEQNLLAFLPDPDRIKGQVTQVSNHLSDSGKFHYFAPKIVEHICMIVSRFKTSKSEGELFRQIAEFIFIDDIEIL